VSGVLISFIRPEPARHIKCHCIGRWTRISQGMVVNFKGGSPLPLITPLACYKPSCMGIILERSFSERLLPKMAVSWPITEFGGMEGFFLLVDSRPFWEAAFFGTAFAARNRCMTVWCRARRTRRSRNGSWPYPWIRRPRMICHAMNAEPLREVWWPPGPEPSLCHVSSPVSPAFFSSSFLLLFLLFYFSFFFFLKVCPWYSNLLPFIGSNFVPRCCQGKYGRVVSPQ